MGGPPMVAALSRRVATATPVALVGPAVSSATGSGSSPISLGGGALVSLLLPGFRKRERRKRGERELRTLFWRKLRVGGRAIELGRLRVT